MCAWHRNFLLLLLSVCEPPHPSGICRVMMKMSGHCRAGFCGWTSLAARYANDAGHIGRGAEYVSL